MAFKSDASACTNTRLPWKVAKKITKTMSVDDTDGSLVIENPVEINDKLVATSITSGFNLVSSISDLREEFTLDLNEIKEKDGLVLIHAHGYFTKGTQSYGATVGKIPHTIHPGHACEVCFGYGTNDESRTSTGFATIKSDDTIFLNFNSGIQVNVANYFDFVLIYYI